MCACAHARVSEALLSVCVCVCSLTAAALPTLLLNLGPGPMSPWSQCVFELYYSRSLLCRLCLLFSWTEPGHPVPMSPGMPRGTAAAVLTDLHLYFCWGRWLYCCITGEGAPLWLETTTTWSWFSLTRGEFSHMKTTPKILYIKILFIYIYMENE